MTEVQVGDHVIARSAFGEDLERRALSGVMMGKEIQVIWVCREEEWLEARAQGREPEGVPWPAEDVELVEQVDTGGLASRVAIS